MLLPEKHQEKTQVWGLELSGRRNNKLFDEMGMGDMQSPSDSGRKGDNRIVAMNIAKVNGLYQANKKGRKRREHSYLSNIGIFLHLIQKSCR
jgi:hypothetical protein